jgi:hypothetical protein
MVRSLVSRDSSHARSQGCSASREARPLSAASPALRSALFSTSPTAPTISKPPTAAITAGRQPGLALAAVFGVSCRLLAVCDCDVSDIGSCFGSLIYLCVVYRSGHGAQRTSTDLNLSKGRRCTVTQGPFWLRASAGSSPAAAARSDCLAGRRRSAVAAGKANGPGDRILAQAMMMRLKQHLPG